ncbi:MAG: T9SS type A sorting domain-containing protein [Ignavibacteriaceae bacterium]|nr:T9SS type A sorting domain-containing protein [Ignavibacteriaceae bacterium]
MKNYTFSFFLIFLTFSSFSLAQKSYQGHKDLKFGTPIRAYLNLNSISTVFKNTGISDIDESEQNFGFKFPKETGKTAVYESGLLWGVKIPGDPQVRVGGSTNPEGLQGGKIISPGIAEDPNSSHVRIYRVRPDVYPGGPPVDLSWEAQDEGKTEQQVRDQYELDWNEWRAQDGAPFIDIDSNGVYDPVIDIPGIKDAAQTIWFVANDLDTTKTQNLYGTDPIGIEYQATFWEYTGSGVSNNFFFRRYKLINKSNTVFDSMYVSMWSDPDIGQAGNDFAGCDTMLSLGFGYNASASDPIYEPLPPPAVGFKLIRGPLIPGELGQDRNKNGVDDAKDQGITEDNLEVNGYINLPMTAFYYFAQGDPNLGDPPLGTTAGANQFYNFMQGKYGMTGTYFLNPVTGLPTTYSLSGDPVTQSGWIDGIILPPGDRRLGLSTGPFQMLPGDHQTIVIAEIAAGAVPGIDHLQAISLLKYYSTLVQDFYDNNFPVSVPNIADDILTKEFQLYQNYPNPFNPVTKIKYTIPSAGNPLLGGARGGLVTLKVYDILGRELATLVNEEKPAGTYEVIFDSHSGEVRNLPSGIYFYQLKAGGYSETKKMMLLK